MTTQEARFSAPDLERLLAFSLRLRAFMAMLARNPDRTATHEAQDRFWQLCNEARLDLRVCSDLPAGVVAPRTDREALTYMRRPRYCRTTHWERTQAYVDRRAMEPRLLVAVDRLVSDARKLGVPLYPAAVDDAKQVHIGHATERFLPWACWDLIADWAYEAGLATTFRLVPSDTVPGHFRLADDAPDFPEREQSERPKRLDQDEVREEREALLRYYSGGDWQGHPHDQE